MASNRSFGEIGIFEGHHDLSHHSKPSGLGKEGGGIDLWYVKQFSEVSEENGTNEGRGWPVASGTIP